MSYENIAELVESAHNILIIQADNPDGDSLGSALALESILGDLGKNSMLYAAVDVPNYLRFLPGWDRVSSEVPDNIDMSIIVDASTETLIEKLLQSPAKNRVTSKPCLVLDHHAEVSNHISFATVLLNDTDVSSTGELIYNVSTALNWPIDPATSGYLMLSAILADTQGLSNGQTSPSTYRVVADLIERDVNRAKLEEDRRAFSKMPVEILRYKAKLIERAEFHLDNQLAIVVIPHEEIITYSPLYNPAPLIQNDLLQTLDVGISVVLKHYSDGKTLAAIRCNSSYPIGAALAEHFGGGGHAYASGFKIVNGKPIDAIKTECIAYVSELLDTLDSGVRISDEEG